MVTIYNLTLKSAFFVYSITSVTNKISLMCVATSFDGRHLQVTTE